MPAPSESHGPITGGLGPDRVIETRNASQTEAFGGELAGMLAPGDVVLIEGDLGAGKSTLVRGACRALGVRGAVTSPTFTIGHLYGGAQATVAHVDLYRVGSLEAEDPGLLADYIAPDLITFVEWPGVGAARLGAARLHVEIAHLGGDRRRLELSGEFESGGRVKPGGR